MVSDGPSADRRHTGLQITGSGSGTGPRPRFWPHWWQVTRRLLIGGFFCPRRWEEGENQAEYQERGSERYLWWAGEIWPLGFDCAPNCVSLSTNLHTPVHILSWHVILWLWLMYFGYLHEDGKQRTGCTTSLILINDAVQPAQLRKKWEKCFLPRKLLRAFQVISYIIKLPPSSSGLFHTFTPHRGNTANYCDGPCPETNITLSSYLLSLLSNIFYREQIFTHFIHHLHFFFI